MGPQEDYIETVVTCEGNFHDPQLQDRLRHFQQRLESLLLEDGNKQLILKKVEPWNSVRVTFSIPRQAALRLRQLAEQGNACLRQMGVLGVQIQGDRLVSLTVATSNNQRAELIISTHGSSGQTTGLGTPQGASVGTSFDPSLPSSSEEQGSPGPNMEVTRKNIEEYLRQGSLFRSILPSSSAAGPSGSGPSLDSFKIPADGGPYRMNNMTVSELQGHANMPGFPERSTFLDNNSHGVNVPVPGQHSARISAAQHITPHQPQKCSIVHQKQQHQQLVSQATALPQTAAVSYSMMGLPPPPPYPHGHAAGVANNVRSQGKRIPASSPLLINLLQTEPVAGSNNVMSAPGSQEKIKKKRPKRKDKQVGASSVHDGHLSAQGIPTLPLDSNPLSGVAPPQATPSQEEMSAVLHRQVSPVPLPSPRFSTGFGNSLPVTSDHGVESENLRDRNTSTASAALASLAQNQRSVVVESEQFSGDTIINPYTGHMEPRDSASDLSPVKKDQNKSGKVTESIESETSVSGANLHLQVSVAATKADARTGTSDSVHIDFGSYQPGAALQSSLREEWSKSFPPSAVTSVSFSEQALSLASDTGFGQHPSVSNTRVTTVSSTLPISAASHIYAQHPFGPSQPLTHELHTSQQHSSHLPITGTPSVNGPVNVTSSSSSHTVSSGQSPTEGRLQVPQGVLGSGFVEPYHHSSHRPQFVQGDMVHNVSVGHDAKGTRGDGQAGDAGNHQQMTVLNTQPVTSKAVPVVEVQQSAVPASTVAAQVKSDSVKLLNSSSSAVVTVTQSVAVDSGTVAASTNSPAGIKPPSDGEDSSNHSGVSPVSTIASAPSSLLDTNGTKVDNHDSGMGSSSERSDDTTPSEAGDGEFQTSVASTESATDSSCGKSTVGVKKAVVNCKKATAQTSDSHTITVGYVQMNQRSADLYNKETKKYIADSSPVIGDKGVAEDTLQEMSNLIKSSSSLMPLANQVSLSLPAKMHSLQHQQAVITHKVTDKHMNGPTSLLPGLHSHQAQSVHLPNNTHSAVRHSNVQSIAPNEGNVEIHPPASTPTSQTSHQQTGGVADNQGLVGWYKGSSIPNSPGQGGHHPSPLSMHIQTVRTGFQPGAVPSGHRTAVSMQMPTSGSTDAISTSSHSRHNSHIVSGPLVNSAAEQGTSSSAATKSQIQTTTGKDVTISSNQAVQPVGNVSKLPSQSHRAVSQGQGAHALNITISPSNAAPHYQGHGGSLNQTLHTAASPSLQADINLSCSADTHLDFQGPVSEVSSSHGPTSHATVSQDPTVVSLSSYKLEETLAKSLPSPSTSVAALENTTAHISGASEIQVHMSLGSCAAPLSSTHNAANSSHSLLSTELEATGQAIPTTTTSASRSSESGLQTESIKMSSSSMTTPSVNNPGAVSLTSSPNIMNATSEVVKDTATGDFALMDSRNDDAVFDSEDLALITEPGLSAYLDVGVRHGAANGSVGVSAETRAGSNITSMYAKRSSPINVNMLNHIYAAGLPQPRRLTESVQRVVKPLPNPENSLLPGRTCKSPSASSRHSSNGSASPGRASQGGSRSPGANISAASSARNLTLDKLTSSLSSLVNNSLGSAGSNTSAHMAHPAFGGSSINCVNTSVVPAAPHPLATLQSSGNIRHKAGNGLTTPSSIPLSVSASLSSSCTPSVVRPSLSTSNSSASLSSLSASVTVMPHTVIDMAASSHPLGNSSVVSHDQSSQQQLDHHSQPGSGLKSRSPIPHTGPVHRPPTPLSISLPPPASVQQRSVQLDSAVCRVSSPAALPRLSLPGGVSAMSNHVPAHRLPHHVVPPDSHGVTVSVCNTPRLDTVTNKAGGSPSVYQSPPPPPPPSSSVHHQPSVSLSSPVVRPASSSMQPLQHFSSVPPTQTVNSSVTVVPSSIDLSSHAAVAVAQVHPTDTATSSVCVSNVLAATMSVGSALAPKLVTVISSHSVASESQQELSVDSLPSSDGGCCANPVSWTSSSSESIESKHQLVSAQKHSVSDSITKCTNSERNVPKPSFPSQTCPKDSAMAHISAAADGHQLPRPSSQNDSAVFSENTVSESQRMAENLSRAAKCEERGVKEKEREGIGRASSSPVSHNSTQDSNQNSLCGQAEHLHSRPPLLHPAPPLTLPTLIPSATPPPPPLTPMLPQDTAKKEIASNSVQGIPSKSSNLDGQAEGTSFGMGESGRTAISPVSVEVNTNVMSEKACTVSVDSVNSSEGIYKSTTSSHDTNDLGSLSNESASASLSSEEGSSKTRRVTRKRKSNSESDSSSEPAPKLSVQENAPGNVYKMENKISTSSDHPPKLQKEGKRTHGTDKKEDEKMIKREEEKGGRREDEDKGGKKVEEKSYSKNMSHHDRNILDATPEEVAKKIAAAGNKRRYYTYVLEHTTPGQSYFDTPVLSGRTRSQGTKGQKENSSVSSASTATSLAGGNQTGAPHSGAGSKEDGGDAAASGSKRSTRSLRPKDAGDTGQTKRKRSKEHR